jgi:Phosphoglucomutase/phosphomannomutase, alpha/beta/alpha domain I
MASIVQPTGKVSVLTQFASFCLVYSFVQQNIQKQHQKEWVISIGHDSRIHGEQLAQSFVQGAIQAKQFYTNQVDDRRSDIIIKYTGIVTTPACSACCRLGLVDAAVVSSIDVSLSLVSGIACGIRLSNMSLKNRGK